jgi:thiamine biosynthesis lipoprotein
MRIDGPAPARYPRTLPILLLVPLLLFGCRGADTPVYTIQFFAFDSAVDLSIVGTLREDAQAAAAEVEQDFRFIDRALHAWEPGPMIRVNELLATGEPFAAPPSLLPVIRKSQVLALQSDNLFNPAIGHLQSLWGFHAEEPECRPPPSAQAIKRLVEAAPTMADLYQDGIMLQSDNPAVKLDFNGIATGYAMDLAIENLRGRGIRSALINAGGNVRAIGDRAGRPWRIPIRRATGTGVLGIIQIRGDASVFSTGAFARNFIHDGKTYHNVIDPRTGYPADSVLSVTVLHGGSAAVAEAAANAIMVAGLPRWHEIAKRMGIQYVMLIDDAGTLHMNPAMAKRLELLDANTDIALGPPLIEAPVAP